MDITGEEAHLAIVVSEINFNAIHRNIVLNIVVRKIRKLVNTVSCRQNERGRDETSAAEPRRRADVHLNQSVPSY